MKKTFQLHLRIDRNLMESLQKQAHDQDISLAELCRQKLKGNSSRDNIEIMVGEIYGKVVGKEANN